MSNALVVRGNAVPSLARRVMQAFGLGRRSASIDSKGPFNTPGAAWSMMTGQSPTSYERVGRNIRIKGFEENAVVSACIRVIADLIGPVRIELHRENAKGELTPELTNPGQLVLDRPRVGWSRVRCIQTTAASLVGFGNAYWILERAGKFGAPSGYRIVHPERIRYVYLAPDSLEPMRYDWTDRNGALHSSSWEDVIHFKDLTLDPDALFGFPRGAAALLDMVTDGEATEYVRQIVGNAGTPGLIIGLKQIVTEDQAKKADERFHERMVERGERGRTRFLPGVESVHELGQTLRELEFPDLRAIAREDICAAFGVDPRMISIASAKGNEGGLSGAQYAEARRRLYLQTGAPLMTTIESELDLGFCPEFGDRVRAKFSPDGIAEITEDEEQTSQRVTREWQAGLITREEARASRNRPERMSPRDHVYVPLGAMVMPVVLADEVSEHEAERSDPANDPGQAPAVGASGGAAPGNEDAQPEAAAARQAASAAAFRSRILRRGQRATALTAEQRTALWQLFDQRATREELAYRRTAVSLFMAERTGVREVFAQASGRSRALWRDVPPPSEGTLTDDRYIDAALRRIRELYAEDAAYHSAWLDRYRSLIGETFRSAGEDVAAAVGVSFDLENVRVQRAIQDRARRLADHVTQKTADQITAVVTAGRDAGMGIRDIAAMVDETCFASSAQPRAQRIARTETAGALNQGEYESALATGVLQSHAWLSQRDGDVRDSHVACDGEGFIALGQAFSNGLMHPGDPAGGPEEVINCRCAQLFSDEEPGVH